MKRSLAAILFVAFSASALAQVSPVGVWKTIDDETKKEKSLVRIKETNGVFTGTIEKFLDPATKVDEVCDNGTCITPTCTDGAKNGSETDVDCGGLDCGPCADTKHCGVGGDCLNGVCLGGLDRKSVV